MAAKVFVSYRRDDSAATVGRIYDWLIARYGRDAVFKDVDSIPPGVDFRRHIADIMKQCAIQLVIIGPQWLDATDAYGRRRLENPDDSLRIELETALQRNITVIPILVQNAHMPEPQFLPPSLQMLAYRNAIQVRYDPDFNADMQHVFRAIETVIPALAGRAGATIPAQVNTGIPRASYASLYTSPPSTGAVAASDTLWRPAHPWLVALGPIDALLFVATFWLIFKDSGYYYALGNVAGVLALVGAIAFFLPRSSSPRAGDTGIG